MKLLKLLAYATVGYAIYQFVKGMSDVGDDGGDGGYGRDLDRALNEDPGRMTNMTGPGRGMNVSTQDSSGTSVSHLVGRGVVQT